MITLAFLVSLFGAFVTGVVNSDLHSIVVRRCRLRSGKINKSLRFVVLSDLHGRCFGRHNRRLIRRILALKPDCVLMAGDIMTAKDFLHSIPSSVDEACRLIGALSAHCPVYFSLGNHESRVQWLQEDFPFAYEEMMERFRKAGARILDNENCLLGDSGVRLYGLTLTSSCFLSGRHDHLPGKILRSFMGKADKEHFSVLLAHDPEYLPDYAKWGADLCFCGHFHGGIIRLPFIGGLISPKRKFFPDFSAGLFTLGGKCQLISCGLGTHTLPVRFFNPAELLLVELDGARNKEDQYGNTGET